MTGLALSRGSANATRSTPGVRSRRGPLPREQVVEVQRMRILSAMATVAAESGVESATVARVVSRAGVSRRTFYDLFEDRGDCLAAALEDAVAEASRRTAAAWQAEDRWVERVRGALFALLSFLDEEPELARLCIVHALGGGPQLLARRAQIMQELADIIDEGRGAAGEGREPPPLSGEGVVGAAFSVIHARLVQDGSTSRGGEGALTDLLGPLMGLIVLPYLGPAAARRELSRVALPCASPPVVARPSPDPLEGLEMRLTYRTLRVLSVIAERPGISNRDVGEQAGVSDQGQISKLLGRLARLGLVENTGEGHASGAPNAWRLTPKGAQLHRAISLDQPRPIP